MKQTKKPELIYKKIVKTFFINDEGVDYEIDVEFEYDWGLVEYVSTVMLIHPKEVFNNLSEEKQNEIYEYLDKLQEKDL
jgi:hypothetical protein